MVHITVTSCCSNSCCQTSVKLLETIAFQHITRVQEHWADATQDSGLHTRRGLPTDQTSVLYTTDYWESFRNAFIGGMSNTVDELWWHYHIMLQFCCKFISQSRVEAPTRRGGQLYCSSVANLLQYLCATNFQNIMQFDKVISKIQKVQFFLPHGVV